jgi:hypothetical protein
MIYQPSFGISDEIVDLHVSGDTGSDKLITTL